MDRIGLVFVPGLLCDAQLWRPQVEHLSDIADMWVADHTRSATMAEVARDVLTDAPFEHFALAGLSMGGYVSLEIVRQAPQRVRRLALLDTAARADTPEQTERRHAFIELANRGKFLGVTETLMPLLVHPSRLPDAGPVRSAGPAHAARPARGNGRRHRGREARGAGGLRPHVHHGKARPGESGHAAVGCLALD